jgi:two-component system, OmpR family, response regulator
MHAKTNIPRKILIVEDEGDICLILEMIFNSRDFYIEHVKKISSAEDQFKNNVPDLVILDNRLPDGLGIDFASFIRRFYPNIKIIMISGIDDSLKDLALENGADVFLLKPFTRKELLLAVDRLLTPETVLAEIS